MKKYMKNEKRVLKIFEKNLGILSKEEITLLSKSIQDVSDVLEDKKISCYSYFYFGDIEDGYYLYYITKKYGKLEGYTLKQKPNLKERAELTSIFCDYIYKNFSEDSWFNLFFWFEKIQYILFERHDLIEKYKNSFDKNLWTKTKDKTPKTVTNTTFIYVMFDKKTGLYKIGRSNKVKYREKTLQPEAPMITTITYKQSSSAAENIIHKKYKDKRVRGEWFNISIEDVKDIEKFLIHYNEQKSIFTT